VPRAARRHCPDTHCICTTSRQLFTQLFALPGHAVDSTRSHMPARHAWCCYASVGNLLVFCDGAAGMFRTGWLCACACGNEWAAATDYQAIATITSLPQHIVPCRRAHVVYMASAGNWWWRCLVHGSLCMCCQGGSLPLLFGNEMWVHCA
jgi:hypothetical protein